MKMEQTECSETSALPAYEDGTDRMFRNGGTYLPMKMEQSVPKRRHLPAYEGGTDRMFRNGGTYLPMKMEQSVPKRRHIKFRRR